MIFAPITFSYEPILNAWIRKQVELLSHQLLQAGIDIRPAASDFQTVYVIEYNGETVHCSPEQAYATLQFLQALQEREQRDQNQFRACSRIPLAPVFGMSCGSNP